MQVDHLVICFVALITHSCCIAGLWGVEQVRKLVKNRIQLKYIISYITIT
jgi:hypothetical protein